MDLGLLFQMFIPFTCEIIIASVMLLRHPLRFRFKPYISIPVGLIIAFSSALMVIFGLRYLFKPEQWNEWLNILAYTIPAFGVAGGFYFAYKVSIPKLILISSVAFTFQSMAYQWTVVVFDTGLSPLLYNTLGQDWYVANYGLFSSIGGYVLKIGIYVGCYFFIAKWFVKYSKYILSTINIVVLAIIVYFVINISNAFISQHAWYDNDLRRVLALTLVIFCILFDTLVVGGFRVVEHREESMMIQMTLNSKIREQEMMEQNINFINMKCHDLRKELRRLKSQKGNLTDEDFCLLEESLNFYDSSVKTGNVNIDALIQDKLIYCNSLGIEFTSLVDGEAFKDMDTSDVYFLLVNIIDNAIEAVEHIEDKDKRAISLTAAKQQGVLVIEERNYYMGNLTFNSDGSIKTTKENSSFHGYGTKSIAYIAKKYDGKVTFEVKDNIFELRIVI